MSIKDFEEQIRWVNKAVDALKSEVQEIENTELYSAFDELKDEIEFLIEKGKDLMDVIEGLV